LAAARSLRRTGPALSAELWNYKRRGEHGKAFHNTTGVQVTKCAIWQVCDSICGMALYGMAPNGKIPPKKRTFLNFLPGFELFSRNY